jgi:hypothetical protein
MLKSVLLLLSASTVVGASLAAAQSSLAPVPPAKSVIVAGTPAAAASTPTTGPAPTPRLAYKEVSPGLLARSVFATKDAGPIEVEFVDILVGPKQSVKLAAIDSAELLEIEVGAPSLTADGAALALPPGRVVSIDQGHSIAIENRADRALVARLIKLKGLAK